MHINTTFNNIALIVAGGSGKRMSNDIPKQYLKIDEISLLRICIQNFLDHPRIDAVAVVIADGHQQLYFEATVGLGLLPFVLGGTERQDSVRNGLFALEKYKPELVLIHDAARIFTSAELIDKLLEQIKTSEAVIPAVPISDTIKKVDNHMRIAETVPRENLYSAQTPQVFKFKTILAAHKEFNGQYYTDDASLLEQKDIDVKIVESDCSNYKITSNEDFEFARATIEIVRTNT